MKQKTKRRFIVLGLCIMMFALGGIISQGMNEVQSTSAERPLSISSFFFGNVERHSPGDHIPEENISVYPEQIVINLQDASWASYENTNSMDPVLDAEANGIEIRPATEQQLRVGDIISYRTSSVEGLIVHRIIEINQDSKGWYAKTKGDNNPTSDPGKVRFNDIHGVLVGVIY